MRATDWLLFISFILKLRSFFAEEVIYLPNVFCDAYVDYIETDPKHSLLVPFVVKLWRCHGSVGHIRPNVRSCVPQNVTKVEVFTQSLQTHRTTATVLYNHTSCIGRCTHNDSICTEHQTWSEDQCNCNCNYDRSVRPAKDLCCTPKVWSDVYCNCICPTKPRTCAKRMEWSNEECDCVCRDKFFKRCSKRNLTLNMDTCYCNPRSASRTGCRIENNRRISVEVVALVMVAEALFIVFGYVVYCIVCRKLNDGSGETSKLLHKKDERSSDDVEVDL